MSLTLFLAELLEEQMLTLECASGQSWLTKELSPKYLV